MVILAAYRAGYPRQPEHWERRIVGMDREPHARGLCGRRYGFEKEPEVLLQCACIDRGIAREHRAKNIEREAEPRTRKKVERLAR